jgi:hypothetical protein
MSLVCNKSKKKCTSIFRNKSSETIRFTPWFDSCSVCYCSDESFGNIEKLFERGVQEYLVCRIVTVKFDFIFSKCGKLISVVHGIAVGQSLAGLP